MICVHPAQSRTSNWPRRSYPVMKRALGRGLGALLPSTDPEEPSRVRDLPIESLVPNPHQPRKTFAPEALAELAASNRASGILEPIIARPRGDRYEIVVGERRWRAAQQVGLTRIPTQVRELSDAETLELALEENLLREDLNPIEAAQAYQRLLGEFGWTQEVLAQRLGKDRSSIANALRLLRLPEPIQADLRSGRLTMGHALVLLSLTSEADQLRLRDEILAHSWTVRAAEQSARAVEAARGTVRRPRPARRHSAELAAVEASLQRALMTRVRIRGSERLGTIEIAYANADELERLAELLGPRP